MPYKDLIKKKENDRKHYLVNREKRLNEAKQWRKDNPEKCKEYYNNRDRAVSKLWRIKNKEILKEKRRNKPLKPEKIWEHHIKYQYGLTKNQFDIMFEEQEGKCAICNKPENLIRKGKLIKLSIDHNHNTNEVRGLLCSTCNFIVGLGKEDIDIFKSIIRYLEKYQLKKAA